jgi:hypothetical protein
MNYKTLVLYAIPFLASCQEIRQQTDDVMKVDVFDTRQVPLSDWISSVEIIPLETNEQSIVGTCRHVEYRHQRFYIHDDRQHAVFVFDSTGKFLFNTLSNKGRGRGEYDSMTGFVIHPSTGNLEILDPFSRKINVYDRDGNFIREITLPRDLLSVRSFQALPDDLYLFYTPRDPNDDRSLQLFSVRENRVIKRTFPLPEKANCLATVNSTSFYWLNDTLHFSPAFSNNEVFQVTEGLSTRVKYAYDYGKHTFHWEKLPAKQDRAFYGNFYENNPAYAFEMNMSENNLLRFCFFMWQENMYIHRYDKQTRQQEIASYRFKDGGCILPPRWIDDTFIYNVANPDELPFMITKGLLSSRDQEKVDRVKEDDNPVIIKYRVL